MLFWAWTSTSSLMLSPSTSVTALGGCPLSLTWVTGDPLHPSPVPFWLLCCQSPTSVCLSPCRPHRMAPGLKGPHPHQGPCLQEYLHTPLPSRLRVVRSNAWRSMKLGGRVTWTCHDLLCSYAVFYFPEMHFSCVQNGTNRSCPAYLPGWSLMKEVRWRKTNSLCYHLYVEPPKWNKWTYITKQKWTQI